MLDIYLDNNATTKLRLSSIEILNKLLLEPLGNPSSPHSWGKFSRDQVERCRLYIAEKLHCQVFSVFFTSCASESNSMVLRSIFETARKSQRPRIITTAIEHSSILNTVEYLKSRGADIVILPVNNRGLVDFERLSDALKERTDLVSIQWVNNETGIIQEINQLAQISHKHGASFHTDAVQAIGKIEVDLRDNEIDFLSFTGHKLHAPQGVGVLIAKKTSNLVPLIFGGEQERELRAGTENLIGISMLFYALADRFENFICHNNHISEMRDTFEEIILKKLQFASSNGSKSPRVSNTTNIRFNGIDGRALVVKLDQAGVICSQSSACRSSIPEPSYVLRGMGLSEEESYSSIRFSFSVDNTMIETLNAADIVCAQAIKLQELTSFLQ